MKKIFILSLLVITTILGFAQTPQKFSYQSVVRNTDSDLVTEQEVGMKISILQGSVNGSEVYIETHQPMTNVNGLLTIEIGSGNVQSGVFSDIDWSDDIYFIKSEIDPEGLSNYTIVGVSQLLSVPYALHAKTAENTFSGDYNDLSNTPPIPSLTSELTNDSGYITNADDNDSDASNEIQDLQLVGDELRITNNGSATTIDLSPYLDNTDTQLTEVEVDAMADNNGYLTTEIDGDINNEIQDLQLVGNNLTITNNGSATTIDLSPYLDDADTQLTESEVDTYVSNNGYLTSFTEVDGSTTNEIQDLQLVGNNLTITNNGTATTIDLSPYLDDTDTNTQLTESEVDTYVSNNGYLTSEVDGSTTNEIQDLQLVGNNLTITNNGTATTIDLSPYLDDTDTNTQLTEDEVDTYVSNNGYLTSEVDGSTTNEIQDLQLVGNNLTITNNGTATTIDLSPYLDDTDTNTQLTESEVDTYVSNNGYLTSEVDGSTTNEIQDLQLVGNNLTITNNGSATTIDLSPYLDDTDTNTQLTESEVDTYVSNNGYLTSEVDGSTANELQSLSISGHDITLSNGGGTVTVPDNNTTYSAGNQLTLSGTTFNVSEGAGSGLDADMLDGVHYTDIQTWVNSNDDNTTYIAGTGLNLSGTTFNANFGTSAGTISEGNHTHTNMVTGTGNVNHIAYWNSATDLTFDNFDFFYVPTTSSLYMGANSGGSQLNMWGDASIQLQNSNSFTANGDRLGYLGFTDNHLNTPTAKIVAYRGNAGGSGDLPTDIAFETTADGTTTLVERMRISHNGNIGIGTPSPFYRLHIQNLDHYRSMHIAHNNSLSIDYQKGIALYMNVTSAEPAGILSEVKTTSVGGFPISNAYAFDGMGDTRGSSGAFDKAAGGYFEGWADYVAYGVLAHGRSTQSAYGVYGTAQSGTTRYGVAGYADATIVNSYAVYAMGDFTATGTKAATVKTENGPKELYSQESPEIWFEDFGGAKVNNGIAKVDLKDDFLSTVTINNEHPIKVFITPNSNLGNWWVEKKGISFVLHAPDATDGSEFDFRVVAKRAGYEDYRMEDAPAAYADYNLYKNIDEVPEEYRSIWIQNAPDEVKERYPQYYNSKSKENVEDRK